MYVRAYLMIAAVYLSGGGVHFVATQLSPFLLHGRGPSTNSSKCNFIHIMTETSATKFPKRKAAASQSLGHQSSFSSTKSGIFETIVFTKKILQTTKSNAKRDPAKRSYSSHFPSSTDAVGFFASRLSKTHVADK